MTNTSHSLGELDEVIGAWRLLFLRDNSGSSPAPSKLARLGAIINSALKHKQREYRIAVLQYITNLPIASSKNLSAGMVNVMLEQLEESTGSWRIDEGKRWIIERAEEQVEELVSVEPRRHRSKRNMPDLLPAAERAEGL